MSLGRSGFLVDDMVSRPPSYNREDVTHHFLVLCRDSWNHHRLEFNTTEFLNLNVPRKAEPPQGRDSIPIDIDFVPSQAMTGSLRMGVMVIVPAFAKGEQRHPKAVPGRIAGGEPLPSPHVGGRVYQPGGVETYDRTEEDAPQQEWPSANSEKYRTQHSNRDPVPAADP